MKDPLQPNELMSDYPKLILNEYGLNSIEGGFFVDQNSNLNDNFLLFFKGI